MALLDRAGTPTSTVSARKAGSGTQCRATTTSMNNSLPISTASACATILAKLLERQIGDLCQFGAVFDRDRGAATSRGCRLDALARGNDEPVLRAQNE
jgi:hypothetical protein